MAAQVLDTVTGSLSVARDRDRLLCERRSNVVAAFRKAGLPGIEGDSATAPTCNGSAIRTEKQLFCSFGQY